MNKVFIIAEVSANHGKDYTRAETLIKAAKATGADAVKLQTYTPDTMTLKSGRPEFVIKGGLPWDGQMLYELYKDAYMPWEWQPKLKELANEIGIELFSTPFDKSAVDFLETLNVKRYKIASYEITDLPLIEYVASKKKPMIISTGMATLEEIVEAIHTAAKAGVKDITLLKCTSAYPSPPDEMNLMAIPHLGAISGGTGVKLSVGLSDHTLGIGVSVAAVALGATVVEKHITLSRSIKTPDSSFSLEPDEFKVMVDQIRVIEEAIGERYIGSTISEKGGLLYRRSIFATNDIKQGEKFTEYNIRVIRPSYGLLPRYLPEVLGKRAKRDISKGTPLKWDLIGG